MKRAVVIGCGACLPQRVMANRDFEANLNTSHDWIVERTGIHERHIAAREEKTSDFAVGAGAEAIARAGVEPSSVDLVILATTTPDDTMPSTATKVQHRLGIARGAAFDINAACSGFVYAMHTANAMIVSGQANRVLVIGAETYSRILDWTDRSTCILFGDGAAALLLEAQEGAGSVFDRGLLSTHIHSDGQYTQLLATTGGVSATQTAGMLYMLGKEIYRHAVAKMSECVEFCLAELGIAAESIDWLAPHQANMRILLSVAQKLRLNEQKVIATVSKHANTSAASIPLALHTALMDGRLKPGHLVASPALGAGLTWGCCIFRW